MYAENRKNDIINLNLRGYPNGGSMNNTERLTRISNALGLEAIDVVEILQLSEVEMTEFDVNLLLTGQSEKPFEYESLEAFLNGLIIFNRGEQPTKDGEEKRKPMLVGDPRSVNTVVLKKLKIAFSLSSEDMLDLFKEAKVDISKEKLSSMFRKEGHKSYKYCRHVYVIGFLNALAERDLM